MRLQTCSIVGGVKSCFNRVHVRNARRRARRETRDRDPHGYALFPRADFFSLFTRLVGVELYCTQEFSQAIIPTATQLKSCCQKEACHFWLFGLNNFMYNL